MNEPDTDKIEAKARELHFSQQGDVETARFIGSLVRLARPRRVLELGTGVGLTTSHILANLGSQARFETVEQEASLVAAARAVLPDDDRLEIRTMDGEGFIRGTQPETYDFVFADTWPGKYTMLDQTLALVRPDGLYVADDMTPSASWTLDHTIKAETLLRDLREVEGWRFTYLPFGTGLALGVKAKLRHSETF